MCLRCPFSGLFARAVWSVLATAVFHGFRVAFCVPFALHALLNFSRGPRSVCSRVQIPHIRVAAKSASAGRVRINIAASVPPRENEIKEKLENAKIPEND